MPVAAASVETTLVSVAASTSAAPAASVTAAAIVLCCNKDDTSQIPCKRIVGNVRGMLLLMPLQLMLLLFLLMLLMLMLWGWCLFPHLTLSHLAKISNLNPSHLSFFLQRSCYKHHQQRRSHRPFSRYCLAAFTAWRCMTPVTLSRWCNTSRKSQY